MHDGRQLFVRAAKLFQQALDASERKVDELRVKKLQIGQELVARLHRGLFDRGPHLKWAVCNALFYVMRAAGGPRAVLNIQ